MRDRFLRERKYLSNVTENTLNWHRDSLRCLPNDNPTQEELNSLVLKMREQGLAPTSVNTRARSINAYLRWAGSPHRIGKLKVAQHVPSVYTPTQIQAIIRWKPQGYYERRTHTLLLTLFDTGCRLDEVLSLTVQHVDFDNCLLTVLGKGRKARIIPFSVELRKHLAKFVLDYRQYPTDIVFSAARGRKLLARNIHRDVRRLCCRLGFQPPARTMHSCRHTFASEYIRRGGSPFLLMRTLGHTTLTMTNRYVSLATTDLQAAHQRVSLLSR